MKTAVARDIVALVGLKDTTMGETLCDKKSAVILKKMDFPEPAIKVAVEPMPSTIVCPVSALREKRKDKFSAASFTSASDIFCWLASVLGSTYTVRRSEERRTV